jgi:multiple sugar transport system ATP-binding protein
VVVDDIGGTPPEVAGPRGLRRFGNLVKRVAGRGGERELVSAGVGTHNGAVTDRPGSGDRNSRGVFSDPGRHQRRPAELAVRLAPYPAVGGGHPLAVSVRMEALHFFDDRGQRIDVGWR